MKNKIILSIIMLLTLTGCWNYRELNQLAIATAMAVDLNEEGNYEVSILISNAKKTQVSSKEGESQTIVYSDSGRTITEAIRNINLKIPKEVYVGHLSVIVINDKIAKNGMYPILDYFLREPESVKRFFLIIAKDNSAKDILSILSPLEAFPSQNIYYNIKVSTDSQAISPSITYSKFVETMIKKGAEPFLPTIILEGDAEEGKDSDSLDKSNPSTILKLDTVAIFKDDKLLGYADIDESRGINFIDGKVTNTSNTFTYNESYITLNLANIKVDRKLEFIDNKPVITINFKSTAAIREIMNNVDLNDINVIKEIEKLNEESIKETIQKGIDIVQKEYNSDIFGFGNMIYKSNPNYFNSISEDWNTIEFPNLKININVDIKLQTKGSLETTIGGLINEISN